MAEKKERKGEITAGEAGRRGGRAMARTHGHEFYEDTSHKREIGSKKGGEGKR